MARQAINIGGSANDGTGDTLRAGATKLNSMTSELYGHVRRTRSGYWYPLAAVPTLAAGSAANANQIRWTPFYLEEATTIAALGTRITTQSAGSNVQMAIYASGADGLPTGSALVSTGDVSGATTGAAGGSVTPATLQPGLYWFGLNSSDATVAVISLQATVGIWLAYFTGDSALGNLLNGSNGASLTLSTAQTYGAWPNNPAVTVATPSGSHRTPFGALQVA